LQGGAERDEFPPREKDVGVTRGEQKKRSARFLGKSQKGGGAKKKGEDRKVCGIPGADTSNLMRRGVKKFTPIDNEQRD